MFKSEIKDYNLDIFVPTLTSDLLGFCSIAFVSLIVVFVAIKRPEISKIIFVALIARILVMLFGHYFVHLPDTTNDALGFEWGAWNWAQDGFINVLKNYPGINSFFYSWVIAIPYSLFGRSILMMQSIGLLFGIGSVFLGWLLAKKLWDDRIANKVGWILALFPSLVLYSITPLREVYSSFFILVAIIGMVNWTKTDSLKSIILAMIGFIGAGFFHGALTLGGVVFLVIVSIRSFKEILKSIVIGRISRRNIIIAVLSLSIFGIYFSNNLKLEYLGTFESLKLKKIQNTILVRMKGNATYAKWTKINSEIEIIYKLPARAAYFLFSPFPWDAKKPFHWIGVVDGFLYMILVYLIFLNRKTIWRDPALRIILIILVFYILMFGVGVSNFGAGARHRSKFVLELILLAAPLIPIFNFKKKVGFKF